MILIRYDSGAELLDSSLVQAPIICVMLEKLLSLSLSVSSSIKWGEQQYLPQWDIVRLKQSTLSMALGIR